MTEFFAQGKMYNLFAICIIIFAILWFILRFEKRKVDARELVMLAVLISLAVAGRAVFYMTPQFKPMAAIVIITGVTLGGDNGFLCGAMSVFISNMFFGQGPWTVWQMLGFGLLGLLAGTIFSRSYNKRKIEKRDIVRLCFYGGVSTFIIYGLIVDTATVFMSVDTPSLKVFLATYASGVLFNVVHAVSTVIFLAMLSKPMIGKINRLKKKFGNSSAMR